MAPTLRRGSVSHARIPTIVADGRAALEAVRTGRFDVVRTDAQMPLMDGFEATRRIRAELPPSARPERVSRGRLPRGAQGGLTVAGRARYPDRVGESRRYPVLAEEARAEIEVQASRFLASLAPVEAEADAHAFVARIRAEMPDATHHCWGFVVGPPGSTARVGFSDDGEPHNSAGRPILNVLLHADVGDVAAVVTRYYGGTKLGRGGLVRAYGGAVQEVLRDAPRAERIDWARLDVSLDYALVALVERLYPDFEAEILEQAFAEQVSQAIRVPRPRRAALEQALADASRGAIRVVEP